MLKHGAAAFAGLLLELGVTYLFFELLCKLQIVLLPPPPFQDVTKCSEYKGMFSRCWPKSEALFLLRGAHSGVSSARVDVAKGKGDLVTRVQRGCCSTSPATAQLPASSFLAAGSGISGHFCDFTFTFNRWVLFVLGVGMTL